MSLRLLHPKKKFTLEHNHTILYKNINLFDLYLKSIEKRDIKLLNDITTKINIDRISGNVSEEVFHFYNNLDIHLFQFNKRFFIEAKGLMKNKRVPEISLFPERARGQNLFKLYEDDRECFIDTMKCVDPQSEYPLNKASKKIRKLLTVYDIFSSQHLSVEEINERYSYKEDYIKKLNVEYRIPMSSFLSERIPKRRVRMGWASERDCV